MIFIYLPLSYQIYIMLTVSKRNFKRKVHCAAKTSGRRYLIVKLYMEQQGKCHYCHCDMLLPIGYSLHRNYATLDHVIPYSDGGTLNDGNAVAACARCNVLKGSMPYSDFMVMRQAHMRGDSFISSADRKRKANDNFIKLFQDEIEKALTMQTANQQDETI